MRYRRTRCHTLLIGGALALSTFAAGDARAVMGGETIMDRVDADGDKTLSLAEVRAAAAKRYDLIRSKNGGHVTMLQLGGRLVPADLKTAGGPSGLSAAVSKDEYLALASKFFDAADAKRTQSDAPGSGKLDVEELESPAGKKLVGLLQ